MMIGGGPRGSVPLRSCLANGRRPAENDRVPRKTIEKGDPMSEQPIGAAPRSFLIISIVALLWNLFGVMSYIMHVTISPEALAAMPAAERALYETSPAWVTGAFAVAVFAGVAACVALLLKKAWAVPLFLVSLIAVVAQFGHWLFVAESIEVYGMEAIFMPLLVTVIAVFLVWYSRDAKRKGWLR
jgi:hypothetical protein